jgi:hypothetical protein
MMLTTSVDTRLMRSTDAGLSWQQDEPLRGVQGYDIAVLDGALYLAHQRCLWRTQIE